MPAWTYAITSFGTGLSIPAGWSGDEGYGSMLLFKATRGNGTYTTTAPNQINSAVHIIDCDAHSPMDRLGSINEASD
jgi:hypothetical protein